ncbi:hypothetical protein EDC04DRAFT_1413053 [Pisolithus marmoratus]|nr:hypothetical protein EDC04DRAFT_1413053 [Pisolithus marmoratus]
MFCPPTPCVVVSSRTLAAVLFAVWKASIYGFGSLYKEVLRYDGVIAFTADPKPVIRCHGIYRAPKLAHLAVNSPGFYLPGGQCRFNLALHITQR